VAGGHAAAKRVARALRGDADDPKKFPFKLRAAALDAGEEALLEQALRDVAKAKTKTPATTKAPAMGGRKGGGGGIRGGGNKKMLGPATTRSPRQHVGEHPLYKPEGTPQTNARPVAADFPILGAARTTTAADFPALNGAAWQPAPAPEDFPATLRAAPVSQTNWRPDEAAPAAAPEAFPTLSTGGSRRRVRADAAGYAARGEAAPAPVRAAVPPVERAAPTPAPAPVAHIPSPAELLSNFASNQARENQAREAAARAAAAAEPAPTPPPEPPTLPHPWQAFWDAGSEKYYFGHSQTAEVTWTVPVAAPPAPPPPPPPPAYSEASYQRLVAELEVVKCIPTQGALDILRDQQVTVGGLCDLTHSMLMAAGIDGMDVHKIWAVMPHLVNRRTERES